MERPGFPAGPPPCVPWRGTRYLREMLLLLLAACEGLSLLTTDATAGGESASAPAIAGVFRLEPVVVVAQPTAIAAPPGPGQVVYVTQQSGQVVRVVGGKATVVLDLAGRLSAGGERGLLGLAFHPRWPDDPRIFVNYTHTVGRQLRTRVASFRLPGPTAVADPASEVEVLGFDQPYSNHNSGALAFGADGMLYIGVGDGGSGGDPQRHGQDTMDWLGSILRVDVSTAPYAVPKDNPFVGKEGFLPEIWAYGVRNPWGIHVDGSTLWFADVGQNAWEEVNRGVAGANYGWNRLEGNHCFPADPCDRQGTVLPVAEYSHTVGSSVTGGLVYRGPSIPALDGRYVYADYATGAVFSVPAAGGEATRHGRIGLHPTAFGADGDRRLYLGDYGGTLYRFVAP